jgi:hypothetical protein
MALRENNFSFIPALELHVTVKLPPAKPEAY